MPVHLLILLCTFFYEYKKSILFLLISIIPESVTGSTGHLPASKSYKINHNDDIIKYMYEIHDFKISLLCPLDVLICQPSVKTVSDFRASSSHWMAKVENARIGIKYALIFIIKIANTLSDRLRRDFFSKKTRAEFYWMADKLVILDGALAGAI